MAKQSITAREILDMFSDDTYDDGGVMYDRAERWLFRVWRELQDQVFRIRRTVVLPVNSQNHVLLPKDYLDFIALGYTDCGNFIPLALNMNLAPTAFVEDAREVCNVCQNENLCKMFSAPEITTEVVKFGAASYDKTITRLLNPDGRYTVQTMEPVAKYDDHGNFLGAVMEESVEVLHAFNPNECGCVPATKENVKSLCECGCMEALSCCSRYGLQFDVPPSGPGSYMIFEDAGFIQLSPDNCLNSVMLYYIGDGVCQNGEYVFPIEAMEALVAGVYHLSIAKKRNISLGEKIMARDAYTNQKKLILRSKMRQSMTTLIQIMTKPPRISFY